MIYRLHIHDWRVIAYYLGILIMLVAMAMVFCFVVALALGEYKTAVDFLLSIGISATVGAALILFRYEHGSLDWRQSLIITGLCWVILSLFGALPLSMSGQYASYLDAMFDTVSAFTTTGMSLALDTDHMALSLALWRAIMHLIGGIGVVVIALALGIFGTGAAAASLYRAEARSGQVMPEIRQTSRFILRLAAVIVVVGTIACMIPLFLNGFSVRSALVNGFIVTASAFSTGGMSTHSMGLMYYHSWPLEVIALVLAMLFTIPCTKLLNNNKAPLLCFISTVLNSIGVGLLGLFVRPENVNTNSIWNPMLLIGVLLLGMGYVLFLQSSTVWGKQLYPEDARGQFEGIRILFFVLIPMVVAPLIANPIIKKSGEFVDENGLTAYLPTYTLLLVGAALVLLTIIPLIPAKKYHDKRISEKTAEGKE